MGQWSQLYVAGITFHSELQPIDVDDIVRLVEDVLPKAVVKCVSLPSFNNIILGLSRIVSMTRPLASVC